MKISAVILAAGQGTRMHSRQPKVLHTLSGKPMIWHAVHATVKVTGSPPIVVVGHGADQVRQTVESLFPGDIRFVIQQKQLGTGHAVRQAEKDLRGKTDLVLVTQADMPLLRPETLSNLIKTQEGNAGPISMLTVVAADPRGFGRVIRDDKDSVQAIVEEADATPQQLAVRELNVGAYCFRADWLWDALARVTLSPKGEYYLTDLIAIAAADGLPILASVIQDQAEAIGINNRVHLAEAEAVLRRRINRRWMQSGVTIVDPQTTYVEAGISIGQDTIIHPNTFLQGTSQIGSDCIIGPSTFIRDSVLGDRCSVVASFVEGAHLENDVEVGPFSHLRKDAHLGDHVHLGNFAEVKNSHLAEGVKMGHFSYIGDARIGKHVNIGAGTITANYDGKNKNRTEIDEGAFIGSDTMLVAPLKIGAGARTGAGSVVTKDVPPNTVVVGIPARAIRKLKENE